MKNEFDSIRKIKLPGQYAGGEYNSDLSSKSGELRVVFIFPDLYVVGMSYLGLHILYSLINEKTKYICERAFAPDTDYEAQLRENKLPLTSLENNIPLKDFDVVAFTLQHELNYTNVLNILDLGGIPILREERTETDPIVIAGGPCAFNPEPMSDFIDAFAIGEGEESFIEILDSVKKGKEHQSARTNIIDELSDISGIYVPNLYNSQYDRDNHFINILPKSEIRNPKSNVFPIIKRISKLEDSYFPTKLIIPNIGTVHDRISIEIRRGCTRGCRFCHAGYTTRPVRERSVERIRELALESLSGSGYDQLSFLSLTSGDYTKFPDLIRTMMSDCYERKVALSLPSQRIDGFSPDVVAELAKIRKTGLTFAPEVGSDKLRKVINKNIDEETILGTAEKMYQAGWNLIKLYFMVGFPTETWDDLEAIVAMVKNIKTKLIDVKGGGRRKIRISINGFVPKAHTAFQWCPLDNLELLNEKLKWLKEKLNSRKIEVSYQDPAMTYVEALLARGDRNLGKTIYDVWKSGAKLEGWREHFRFDLWQNTIKNTDYDADWILHRERTHEEDMPWECVSTGVSRDYLWKEYQKSLNGELTPDCESEFCSACGLEKPECLREFAPEAKILSITTEPEEIKFTRTRFKFKKQVPLNSIGHLDLVRIIEQVFKRAKISIKQTEGFNPHPKLTFGPPLPLGYIGESELGEAFIDSKTNIAEVPEILNKYSPKGLIFTEFIFMPIDTPAISKGLKSMEYEIELELENNQSDDLIDLPRKLLNEDHLWVTRTHKRKGTSKLDIRPFIITIKVVKLSPGRIKIHIHSRICDGRSIRPEEVVDMMFKDSEESIRIVSINRVRFGVGSET